MRLFWTLSAAFAVVNCGAHAVAPTEKLPDGSFDRRSAAWAVGRLQYAACRDPRGPFGTGHLTITFEPDGTVSRAVLDDGPFAGTPAGTCLERVFRAVRMRPFDGGPVKVGKLVTLE